MVQCGQQTPPYGDFLKVSSMNYRSLPYYWGLNSNQHRTTWVLTNTPWTNKYKFYQIIFVLPKLIPEIEDGKNTLYHWWPNFKYYIMTDVFPNKSYLSIWMVIDYYNHQSSTSIIIHNHNHHRCNISPTSIIVHNHNHHRCNISPIININHRP